MYNLDDFLLKDDNETNDCLKPINDFDFLNSSLDLNQPGMETNWKNSIILSFNDSLIDISREKKIRK